MQVDKRRKAMKKWKKINESEIKNKDYAWKQVAECVANARAVLGNALDILEMMGVPEDDWIRTRIDSHRNDLDDTLDDIVQ